MCRLELVNRCFHSVNSGINTALTDADVASFVCIISIEILLGNKCLYTQEVV